MLDSTKRVDTASGYGSDGSAPPFVQEAGPHSNGELAVRIGDGGHESLEAPCHPLGVKPLGNQYFGSSVGNARRNISVFGKIPDEALMLLLEHLDALSLRALGSTSRFLFAFCRSEELWKPLLIQSLEDNPRTFRWLGSWRSTLLGLSEQEGWHAQVDCSGVFSDVLHRPFVCSNISLEKYTAGIPTANRIRSFPDLTHEEFEEKLCNTPFVLTEVVKSWPVYCQWTLDTLLKAYPEIEFRAEAVDWPLSTYHRYMRDTQDESPLYLFDKDFAEKMGITVGRDKDGAAYWKPDCFGDDLFELLGDERPAHRWLIIGPKRSGSTFHKDPNATSAWNAVIQGAKYWIMFPPTVPVPGVYVSEDGGEVTSPLSIAEWLMEFHAEARKLSGCVEGVCKAGEVLHVPSGWWHLVVNLESGIALTQNFVPKSHLSDALGFLRDKADQISGFKSHVQDPFGLFRKRLETQRPELLELALEELRLQALPKKRKWDAVLGTDAEEEEGGTGGGFSFGFLSGDDDEIP